MATTTPNYGWDVPTSTDYVKDGATAIETLGDDIDATLYTALGGTYPGLRLVKKQTIGSGVSSVTVTGAFSATYENYKIIVSGGSASSATVMTLKIGSGNTHAHGLVYAPYTPGTSPLAIGANSAASYNYAGSALTTGLDACLEVRSPFLTKWTMISNDWSYVNEGGANSGVDKDATSYTAFTIAAGSNMTGGTIYVYGYGAS
jgi:hypothetical protein